VRNSNFMFLNLLRKYLFRFSRQKTKPFSAWQIELTTRCPLRCRMCIREGLKDWHSGDMNFDDFKRLLPYFKDVEKVVLEGWGESLLHENLIEIIRLIKAENSEAGFVTSGKGLNKEYISELINAGVDFIGFSLSGASSRTHDSIRVNSDFQKLLCDIKTFNEIKSAKKLQKPRLHIVYLMLKDNIYEIPSLIGLAKGIGIEDIVLTNLIHVTNEWQNEQRVFRCTPPSPNPSHQGRGNLTKKIPSPLAGEGKGEGVYEEVLKEAEVKARELKIRLRKPSLLPVDVAVCEENPLRNLYISIDGEVSPCVYLYPPTPSPFKRIFCGSEYQIGKLSFGNIFREPFSSIWNKKGYVEFRNHFSIPLPEPPEQCKTCHKILGV